MIVDPVRLLAHPMFTGIPFHQQGQPITDPLQKHTGSSQRNVVSEPYNHSNNLVFGRFLGTDWEQVNQPKFLGANERIVFEDSW